ncbi:MAG: TonB-dependent receptor [Deltaproteobacteria bacterium]|nr:TonB-dependent receptor [Deltaproteobacteria bacterium]
MGRAKAGRTWKGIAAAFLAAAAVGLPGAVRAEEATRLDPIVVTATRIEQKVSEQASSVSVVTREEIELRSGAVTGDVLKNLPGVDVQRSGSPGNLENVKIRGGKGTHTLIMIDGFPLNSPSGGEFDISSLPVSGFDRMEVVRGAQSALYGSNAMSGVVNFLPRKPEEGKAAAVGIAGGSFNTVNGNAYTQGKGKRGSFHAGFGKIESSGILHNDDLSLNSFIGVGDLAVGTFGRIHGIVLTTDERKGIPIDDRGIDPVAHKARRDFLAGARWEFSLSRAATLTVSGAEFDEFLHVEEPPIPGVASSSDFLVKTRKTTGRAEVRYSTTPVSTTFLGVEYVKDRAQNDAVFRFSPFPDFVINVSAPTINRSAFVQEELRFGKHDGVSLGLRVDENTEAGTKWNPKAGVFHEFGRIDTTVRAAYGKGFRIPTIVEKFDPTSGNPGLSPETVDSYEAGADWRPRGRKAVVSATFFYQQFKGLIQTGTNIPPGRFFPELENVGSAFSRGVEAGSTWWFHPRAGTSVSYTYSDTWDAKNQRRILGIPRQRGTVSLLFAPTPRLEAHVDWRIESDQLDFGPTDIVAGRRPGYARVDAFARYRWESVSTDVREIALTGKVQNLLNREYEERKGFPAPGFNFLLGAELKI